MKCASTRPKEASLPKPSGMHKCQRRRFTAFTLIELLVVIALVSVLAAIAVPTYYTYTYKAYQSKALTNARSCLNGQYYASVNGESYTPPAGCTSSSNPPSCTCTVSGFAGSVTCTLVEGGSVNCE